MRSVLFSSHEFGYSYGFSGWVSKMVFFCALLCEQRNLHAAQYLSFTSLLQIDKRGQTAQIKLLGACLCYCICQRTVPQTQVLLPCRGIFRSWMLLVCCNGVRRCRKWHMSNEWLWAATTWGYSDVMSILIFIHFSWWKVSVNEWMLVTLDVCYIGTHLVHQRMGLFVESGKPGCICRIVLYSIKLLYTGMFYCIVLTNLNVYTNFIFVCSCSESGACK